MNEIERVEAAEMPHRLVDGYAVRRGDEVVLVVRDDLTENQVSAVVDRITALLPPEVISAAHQRSESAAE